MSSPDLSIPKENAPQDTLQEESCETSESAEADRKRMKMIQLAESGESKCKVYQES